MAILFQELKGAIGFKKQADLHTALTAASMWSLGQINRAAGQAQPINENNAAELNKGHEFATQQFRSHLQCEYPWEYYLSSENAAMAAVFGLGHVVKAAAGSGFKYTCTPLDPVTEGLEMPATTVVQQVRDGFDQALIGVACNEWIVALQSGPGRENAMLRTQWLGCGAFAQPSDITIPTAYAEHLLNAGSIASISVLGQDYIALKSFVSCEFGWRNNVVPGFYPGSGSQDEYQIAGRMRHGTREAMFSLVVELESDSPEFAAVKDLTEGTAVIECTGAMIGEGPAKHGMKTTFHRMTFATATLSEQDNIATVAITGTPLYDTTNGVITVEVTCEQDNIGAEAA